MSTRAQIMVAILVAVIGCVGVVLGGLVTGVGVQLYNDWQNSKNNFGIRPAPPPEKLIAPSTTSAAPAAPPSQAATCRAWEDRELQDILNSGNTYQDRTQEKINTVIQNLDRLRGRSPGLGMESDGMAIVRLQPRERWLVWHDTGDDPPRLAGSNRPLVEFWHEARPDIIRHGERFTNPVTGWGVWILENPTSGPVEVTLGSRGHARIRLCN